MQVRMFDNGIEHALHFVSRRAMQRRFAFLDEEFGAQLGSTSSSRQGNSRGHLQRPKFGGMQPIYASGKPRQESA